MPWNWPNTLTWLRIFAIPLIALLFYMPYPWRYPAAGLMFAAAGITDSLDGDLGVGVGGDLPPRGIFGPCRGQTDRRSGARAAGEPGPEPADYAYCCGDHRPGNHDL